MMTSQEYAKIRKKHEEDMRKKAKNDTAVAQEIWDRLDDNERHGVRFGLFPAWIDREYKMEKGVTVALMNICDKKLGMIM